MTEIEIRGNLPRNRFDGLFRLLQNDGSLKDHYHRLSFDLSPGFDPVTRTWKNSSGADIRLKKSDDKEKLSIKMGNFSDEERKEIEIKLQNGQALPALDFLESLGYSSGMIYYWESWEFDYEGVEIKMSKYTCDYFTFENEGKDSESVDKMAKELNLVPYTKDEYKQAIDWENQNIHHIYDRKLAEGLIKSIF